MKKFLQFGTALLLSILLITATSCSDDKTGPEIEYHDGVIYFNDNNNGKPFPVAWGEKKSLAITTVDIADVKLTELPEGWTAVLKSDFSSLELTAPVDNSDKTSKTGQITLSATDINGQTLQAAITVYLPDYSAEDGTYLVVEGPFIGNGTLSFIAGDGTVFHEIYEKANDGRLLGNLVQDIYIHNGKTYILSQKGSETEGETHLTVVDAETMRKTAAYDLVFQSPDGVGCWPQHMVVTADDELYVQYATNDYELSSGLVHVKLGNSDAAITHVGGTYGPFNSEGATKGRILYSRGKVYVPCGERLAVIRPGQTEVEKTTYTDRVIKGIVKGADNNIYMAMAGTYIPGDDPYSDVEFTSNALIVSYDHNGVELNRYELDDDFEFTVNPAVPIIGMFAAPKSNKIYFTGGQSYTQTDIYAFDITEGKIAKIATEENGVYGYMGMDRDEKTMYVPVLVDYVDAQFKTYTASNYSPAGTSYKFEDSSPAGVDFVYRFTEEYINR